MLEWSRRNSVNYPSRPQPTTGPLFPWPFTAAAPKSSGAFLANSPLLLRQIVSKWPAKLNFFLFSFLGAPRLFVFFVTQFLFVGDTQVNEYENPLVYVGVTMMESRTRQRELEAFSKTFQTHKNL